jgi:hypothetical protein
LKRIEAAFLEKKNNKNEKKMHKYKNDLYILKKEKKI